MNTVRQSKLPAQRRPQEAIFHLLRAVTKIPRANEESLFHKIKKAVSVPLFSHPLPASSLVGGGALRRRSPPEEKADPCSDNAACLGSALTLRIQLAEGRHKEAEG